MPYKNIMADFKETKKKSTYMTEGAWKQREQYWDDHKVIPQSKQNSRNRRSSVNTHWPTTHIDGSIMYVE